MSHTVPIALVVARSRNGVIGRDGGLPWRLRSDMALFIFTRAILANEPLSIFNNGETQRDFTYIDDDVEPLVRLIDRVPAPNPNWNGDNPATDEANAPGLVWSPNAEHAMITQIESAEASRRAAANELAKGEHALATADGVRTLTF